MSSEILESTSQINILIGENGSGKTRKLDRVSEANSKDRQKNLIIINNARCKNLARRSKNYLNYVDSIKDFKKIVHVFIKKIFADIETGDVYEADTNFIKIKDILNYLSYDESLYISVDKQFIDHDFYKNFDIFDGDYTHYEYVHSYLNYLHTIELENGDQVLEIDLCNDVFGNNENTIKFLFLITHYWGAKFDVYLARENILYKFDYLSSGEKRLITNIFFIANSLKSTKKNILIIDEPEVSLHPKWQIEYLENISNVFYKYEIQIFIATHSPLILADLFFDRENFINLSYSIFHIDSYDVNLIKNKAELSIEAIYWNVFGVLTPQNSFLSRQLNKLLNDLHANKIDLNLFFNRVDKFKKASIDQSQIETIDIVMKHVMEKESQF